MQELLASDSTDTVGLVLPSTARNARSEINDIVDALSMNMDRELSRLRWWWEHGATRRLFRRDLRRSRLGAVTLSPIEIAIEGLTMKRRIWRDVAALLETGPLCWRYPVS